MKAVLIFCGVALWDFAWAKYIMATTDRRAVASASCSAGLYLCSAVNVLAITHDRRLIVPGVLGAFVGTWLAVRR